jgi:hypothetical protein
MPHSCHPTAAAVTAIAMLITAASAEPSNHLVVRTYDVAGLPPAAIGSARDAASAVLRDAGVHLLWRDCSTGCWDVPAADEVLLRIVIAPPGAAPGSLGYAVVDLKQGTGALATVYADRITEVARRTRTDAGKLLGRAIAHEIGHLLLGTSDHSADGLMRARWLDREVQGDRPPDWTLSRQNLAHLAQFRR